MMSSLGGYGSRLRHDPIIITAIVDHPNYLIHIMILYQRGGPEAQKTNSMDLVNGIAKGSANEKEEEKWIEIHGNENPPMP